tara:strand:+ start:1888 stop:1989 length:102 start_codon:yes stop_codon:yes gene_type:complete
MDNAIPTIMWRERQIEAEQEGEMSLFMFIGQQG